MSLGFNAALGFAAKAGKVRCGDFTAEKLIGSGKVYLLILDSECSQGTHTKWKNKCSYYKVAMIEKESVGKYIGKPGNMILAVTDENFAQLILQAHESEQAGS